MAQQPAHDLEMEPLGAGHLAIKFRFEPVQQFPGEDHIRLRPANASGADDDAEHDLQHDRRQPDPREEADVKGATGPAAATPSRSVNMGPQVSVAGCCTAGVRGALGVPGFHSCSPACDDLRRRAGHLAHSPPRGGG